MFVRDATISNPLTVGPGTSVIDFVGLVLATNQTTAVVADEDSDLLGIVSVHDIFRVILPHYLAAGDKLASVVREGYFDEKFVRFAQVAVSEIMVEAVDSVAPTADILQAVALFVHKQRKMIPVVERGKVHGIITRRSVLRALRHLPPG